MSDITALLIAARGGDRQALDRLVPLVYDRLRSLARTRMRGERVDHTLDSAALVHEAYLRLLRVEDVEWRDRAHFFAMACRLMRRVLLDHAERRGASKRLGRRTRVALGPDVAAEQATPADDLVILNAALEELEAVSPRACRAVERRHFAGLSLEEIAADLHVSPATVKRDLRFGHAWLARALRGDAGP